MDADELFSDLAARLHKAHCSIDSIEATDAEKARITRLLLAITDASKHDLARASSRLDDFLIDLDAGWRPDSGDR